LKPGNPKSSSPISWLGLLLVLATILTAYALAVSRNHVFSVTPPSLDVRKVPDLSSPPIFVLKEGSRVFFLGDEESGPALHWMKVAFLHRPTGVVLERLIEGWVLYKAPGHSPFLTPESLLAESLAVRSLYKWKVLTLARASLRDFPLPQRVKAFLPLSPDKTLHVFAMFLLAMAIFFFLFFTTGLSQNAALLAALVTTNVLGLSNELLDLLTGMGNFERMDLAANAIGSTGLLLPLIARLGYVKLRAFLKERPHPGS